MSKPLQITELVLRDASQSLLATRVRIEDMLPIAEKLDQVGFWSLETWGGAIFDSCIRYLGEDPWDRIREFKKAMPNTPQQMLFRGQNILGYRHYADDVVERFVERAATNGVDVFRVFDAMNDMRNIEVALKAVSAGADTSRRGCGVREGVAGAESGKGPDVRFNPIGRRRLDDVVHPQVLDRRGLSGSDVGREPQKGESKKKAHRFGI